MLHTLVFFVETSQPSSGCRSNKESVAARMLGLSVLAHDCRILSPMAQQPGMG